MPKPRAKPVSRETRFHRLRQLQCFEAVKQRILAGWDLSRIATYIKEEQHELEDLTSQTIYNILHDFRRSLPPGEFFKEIPANIPDQKITKAHDRAVKQISKGLDEVAELEKLYNLQVERIQIDFEVEQRQKRLIPAMAQEIRIAKELLDCSAKLKMDLGISKRHLGLLETETRVLEDLQGKYQSQALALVLTDAEKRQRVASVAQRLLLSDGASAVLEAVLAENQEEKAAAEVIEVEVERVDEKIDKSEDHAVHEETDNA